MARLITLEYGCNICGTEISVTGEGTGHLSPIYCCGLAVSEREAKKAKKPVAKKSAKKAKKKTTTKKIKTKKSGKKIMSKRPAKKTKRS